MIASQLSLFSTICRITNFDSSLAHSEKNRKGGIGFCHIVIPQGYAFRGKLLFRDIGKIRSHFLNMVSNSLNCLITMLAQILSKMIKCSKLSNIELWSGNTMDTKESGDVKIDLNFYADLSYQDSGV